MIKSTANLITSFQNQKRLIKIHALGLTMIALIISSVTYIEEKINRKAIDVICFLSSRN